MKLLELEIYPEGSTLKQKIQIDYTKGNALEKEKLPVVVKYFNNLLSTDLSTYTLTESRYNCIDWNWNHQDGREVYIELKGRRNVKQQYTTTIFGMNKYYKIIKKLESNPKCRCFVVFNYTDVLAYYEVRLDSAIKGEIKLGKSIYSLRRTSGGEQTTNCEIPVENLIDITEFDDFPL